MCGRHEPLVRQWRAETADWRSLFACKYGRSTPTSRRQHTAQGGHAHGKDRDFANRVSETTVFRAEVVCSDALVVFWLCSFSLESLRRNRSAKLLRKRHHPPHPLRRVLQRVAHSRFSRPTLACSRAIFLSRCREHRWSRKTGRWPSRSLPTTMLALRSPSSKRH